MNTRSLSFGLVVAVLTAVGCLPCAAAQDPVSLRYHFVGTAHLPAGGGGTKARELGALPETRALLNQTLRRLAAASDRLVWGQVSAERNGAAEPLLRPLLEDLVREESVLEVSTAPVGPGNWVLVVSLPAARMGLWRTNVVALARLWGQGVPRVEVSSGEAKLGAGLRLVWMDSGPWFMVAAGAGNLEGLARAAAELKSRGRPVPALGVRWLELKTDLGNLAPRWGWPAAYPWPWMEFSIEPRDENLRTVGRLRFPRDVTGPLAPWRVPTNVVAEPLASFSAWRGLSPLASQLGFWRQLKLEPVPGEFYFWSQGSAEFQSYLAFPLVDATNQLRRATDLASGMFPEWARQKKLAQFAWRETNSTLAWVDLPPMVVPTLRATSDSGRDYVVGGLFPELRRGQVPPELLLQLGQSNLVGYHWEITQTRLMQMRMLTQLTSFFSGSPQLTTNHLGFVTLLKLEPNLGNAVTEVTAVSPREWAVVRKSHLGLTALELVGLVRWLESRRFPDPDVILPEPPRGEQSPGPASRPTKP